MGDNRKKAGNPESISFGTPDFVDFAQLFLTFLAITEIDLDCLHNALGLKPPQPINKKGNPDLGDGIQLKQRDRKLFSLPSNSLYHEPQNLKADYTLRKPIRFLKRDDFLIEEVGSRI